MFSYECRCACLCPVSYCPLVQTPVPSDPDVLGPFVPPSPSSSGQAVLSSGITHYAWNWLSVQFDDNTELTATALVDPKTENVLDTFAVHVDQQGARTEITQGVTFNGSQPWMR